MRISGAVAADDPWLVTGYDVGRFRFQVQTMGVAAMTLQATGQEGSIQLTWQQNDYELLAGYSLYRSDTIDGTYERVNGTIIPPDQVSYTDTDVTPAVPMYYYFTVVATDMTESDPSNVAAAAALDTIPPVISHAPVTSAMPGFGLRLEAEVTDNVSVASVGLRGGR